MTKFNVAQVKEAARSLLEKNPQGMKWAELMRAVQKLGPDTPKGTVQGSLRALRVDDQEIVRPTKGLWVLAKYAIGLGSSDASALSPAPAQKTVPESTFYQPFADWLRDEAEEVVDAMELGGATFKWKWGTPDVIGVNKHRPSDAVRMFDTEIVAAEIKTDPAQSVVAFGQACAYRLFAHKIYIAMPSSMASDDSDRLDTLCGLFGIGLVEFDVNVDDPNFQLKVRARRFDPDRFYVNMIAEMLKKYSRSEFDRLFS